MPGDVLLERGRDRAEPLADAAVGARRAPAEDRRRDAMNGKTIERGEREPPVERRRG